MFLAHQVYWQQIPSNFVWESISSSLLKDNFAGSRILSVYLVFTFTYIIPLYSCLNSAWREVWCHSYLCYSIGKLFLTLGLGFSTFASLSLMFWSLTSQFLGVVFVCSFVFFQCCVRFLALYLSKIIKILSRSYIKYFFFFFFIFLYSHYVYVIPFVIASEFLDIYSIFSFFFFFPSFSLHLTLGSFCYILKLTDSFHAYIQTTDKPINRTFHFCYSVL